MISKYLKFSSNYRNFPRFFTEKTLQAPTPPPPNVHMFLVEKIDVTLP